MTRTHRLDAGLVHYEWNNAIAPRLEIVPGDTVIFDTRDASDGYYAPASTHADVLGRGPFRGHPLTGPVRVRGAAPGDVLVIEILDVAVDLKISEIVDAPNWIVSAFLPESIFT